MKKESHLPQLPLDSWSHSNPNQLKLCADIVRLKVHQRGERNIQGGCQSTKNPEMSSLKRHPESCLPSDWLQNVLLRSKLRWVFL